MRRALGCLGLLLAVLATPAAPALAASKRPDPLEVAQAAAARVKAIPDHLHKGEWDAAARGARRAIAENLGADVGDRLADLVAYLALAEEGEGGHEDAVWRWREALNLGTTVDPAAFGEPGAVLAKVSLRPLGEAPADLPVPKSSGDGSPITPPRIVSGGEPKLPESRRSYPRGIHVEAIVDALGHVHEPVVAAATFPALAYVVLEAMRGWRFDPAQANGQPVASFYELQQPTARPLDKVADFSGSPLAEPLTILKAGRYAEAETKVLRLWSRGLAENDQSSGFLGVAFTERALAEAGLGKEDLAICHYQAAQTIEPRLYGADLSAFGAPGALLMQHSWGLDSRGVVPRPPMTRAEIVSRKMPEFPGYARRLKIQGDVIVDSVIDESGAIRDPVLLRNGPTLGFDASVLDAFCAWRFKPALFEGKPVKVRYTTTVNFAIH
jgi:TonB family protein